MGGRACGFGASADDVAVNPRHGVGSPEGTPGLVKKASEDSVRSRIVSGLEFSQRGVGRLSMGDTVKIHLPFGHC